VAGSGQPSKYTFTGHYETSYGTISFPAREYSPLLGRFLSADSIVPDPRNPQSLNRYSYVYNRPLVLRDPSGHIPVNDWPGGGGDDDPGGCLKNLLDCFGGGPQLVPAGNTLNVQVSEQAQQQSKGNGPIAAKSDSKGNKSSGKGSKGGGNDDGGILKKIAKAIGAAIGSAFGNDAKDGRLDFADGFTAAEQRVVMEISKRTGISFEGITFWRGDRAPWNTAASASTDKPWITLYDRFFKMSLREQIQVLREELEHLLQRPISLDAETIRMLEEQAKNAAKGGQ
jgi:RHS repeat-associated protein